MTALTESQNTACLVCSGQYRASRIPGLIECRNCGFLSADLALSDDAIRALYSSKYFHGQEYADYVGEKDSLVCNFRHRLKTLVNHIPGASGKRLFEIGCAYGFFLEAARAHFPFAQGIDISAEAVAYATGTLGVNAIAGDLLSAPITGPFDVVCMWDVIEHLRRPDLVVARAASLLNDNGILAITTGDIGSLNARLRGKNWRLIHPPTHLHYFSAHTITALLQKHGFRVIRLAHPGTYRTLRNILYAILVLHGREQGGSIYRGIQEMTLLNRAIYLNLFDLMFVVARKDPSPKT